MKKHLYFWLLLLSSFSAVAQELTQSIKGRIVDQQSKAPLPGVTVTVLDTKPLKGATTDPEGYFKIPQVRLGRIVLKISSMGYKEQVLPNILLTSGKETYLDIELEEMVQTLQEITVTAASQRNAIDKGLVTVSGKTFDVEATRRFAGSRNDPARMVAGFAGVTSNNDSRNDIIIRGNSPSGVLWRLEGIDIPNPSHFGALGATGGPVSMLNNNLLAKSTFMTGAFPSMYGNATAGVFDLQLRNGNNDKHEFLGQLGFNGVEFGAEGPFRKSSKASYLINYRYSVLDLIKKLGINFGTGSGVPAYQDLSFKINIPTTHAGTFALFGVGGNSSIKFRSESEDNFYSDSNQNLDYSTNMGVVGFSHHYFFNTATSGKFILSYSTAGVKAIGDQRVNGNIFRPDYRQNSWQNRLVMGYVFNKKLNVKNSLTAGITYNALHVNYSDSTYQEASKSLKSLRNYKGTTGLWQAYTNWQLRPSDAITLNTGLYYQQFTLNNSYSIEPRIGLRYALAQGQTLTAGYGKHAQIQNLQTYFNNDLQNSGAIATNQQLGMTQSQHYVVGYERGLGQHSRIKFEVYNQYLSNVPVENVPSDYSLLNAGASFEAPRKNYLVNGGTGRNLGLEVSLERSFYAGYYYLFTASLYDSKYKGSNGKEHNTAFNGNYTLNLLAGKEWKLGEQFTLAFDTKITAAGGRRYTPVNATASQQAQETIYYTEQSFEKQFKDYFRADLKITLRQNKAKYMQEWFVDLQNVSNTQNVFDQSYEVATGKVKTTYQLGFFPNINYRIQF